MSVRQVSQRDSTLQCNQCQSTDCAVPLVSVILRSVCQIGVDHNKFTLRFGLTVHVLTHCEVTQCNTHLIHDICRYTWHHPSAVWYTKCRHQCHNALKSNLIDSTADLDIFCIAADARRLVQIRRGSSSAVVWIVGDFFPLVTLHSVCHVGEQ